MLCAIVIFVCLWLVWGLLLDKEGVFDREPDAEPTMMYGIVVDDYNIEYDTVRSGETLSVILERYGISYAEANKIAAMPDSLFSIRNFRAGQPYTAMITQDSISPHLDYFVYHRNIAEFVVMSFLHDSLGRDNVAVEIYRKPVEEQRRMATARINKGGSLWTSMTAADMPAAMAVIMEDMFGWSVNFFALQEGDEFSVIYDDRSIDSIRINPGQIYGAVFKQGGKEYYAIPFNQKGRIEWWDEKGNSLKKIFMKVPVRYSRISSRYGSRVHPISGTRKHHNGVDYAAPKGTPVMAAADGRGITRGWGKGGGGNIIKIQHDGGMVSGYMHLSSFNVSVGQRVSQGTTIGRVGSTGASTGPHLHYALWRNGKYINPLTFTSMPVAPLEKKNMPAFNVIKDKVMKELRGEMPDSLVVTAKELERK